MAVIESGAAAISATSATSLATEELIRAMSSTNRANGRRTCTMVLHRLKNEILPTVSRSSLIDLLADGGGYGGDAIAASDCFIPCDENKEPSISATLIMIINQHDEFSTEGHREASVEILKYLYRNAFEAQEENDAGEGLDKAQEKKLRLTLMKEILKCSRVFQQRMSFRNASKNDSFHRGTMTGPVEPSEHIRLLMVELMVDLGGYCLTSCRKDFTTDYENCNKILIEATSIICQTLAKSTLLDPYPEIPRAACDLVQLFAQSCPLAVRMNATSLLVPLTGRVKDSIVGAAQSSTSITASISTRCLMRHRHAKTRCQAVHASARIVLCCPKIGTQVMDNTSAITQSVEVDHLSMYGSHSMAMEHILQHNILPEWEDLLTLDSSASVKLAVLKSLGSIANTLEWRYSPSPTITSPEVSATRHDHRLPPNDVTTDVTTMVEAHVLKLFLMGISSGCVADVRSLAIQQLKSLACEENEEMLPKHLMKSYFIPVMEIILSSCSNVWAVCQRKVGALETLQVFLSIAIPLMNEGDPSTASVRMLVLSDAMVHTIVNILSMNILSDEKEVVEAAFACCRIVGANNLMSNDVLGILCDLDDLRVKLTDSADSVVIHSNESQVAPSPRHLTSQLLILDGLLKGSTNTKDVTSILCEFDQILAVPIPNWFHASLSPATAIAKFFRHTTKFVSSSSSLAWALADTCDSFVKCVHDFESKLSLTDDVIVNVLVGVAFLLGCPAEYGVSSKAAEILRSLSFLNGCIPQLSATCEEEGLSLLDVHFRKVIVEIIQTAPGFPWKQSEPALLAVSALLRTCRGYTVGSNFDLVAPFFVSHLSTMGYNSNSSDGTSDENADDKMAADYSLRISLMALLQTILTDESFPLMPCNQQCGVANMAPSSSAKFTADVIISLVVPNLVWRVGGMASALRKLALATLFSLLIGRSAVIHPDTLPHLIPTLHSSFDDSESSIRELSCVCLSLTLQHISNETFSITWENSPQAIDTILPRLLELLDDNHGPVRIAACNCLRILYPLVQSNISQSSHETITATLLLHLDDPHKEFQAEVFLTLLELIEHQHEQHNDSGFVRMMESQINASMKSHHDTSHCRKLMAKLAEF